MGQCKRCGEVYGAHEMAYGICKNCIKPEDIPKKKTIDPNKKIMKIYKMGLLANILSPISLILAMVLIIILPITELLLIIFFISLVIGNILSIYFLIKFYKKKEYKKHAVKLVTALIVSDTITALSMWLFNGSNLHA